ncbi:hypothetical protein EDF62_0696 [Leucobacter luti]|uniref:YqeB PH domain-containing protein n=1 Tax=Leucobacter luti TaxID=340320 RepID=A0A4R6S3R1_9MICO|nr:hypothetical protein [Leucobacter luti]TDP94282.1 hypothetical protein EDF62_0696 [Leucobacter luti]
MESSENLGTGTGATAGTRTETGTGTGNGAGTGATAGTGTGADSDSDSGIGTGTSTGTGAEAESVLRMQLGTRVGVWLVCSGAGVALGYVLPWVLQHLSTWPIPYLDVLTFLGSFEHPVMVIGRPAVLGLVGLICAFVITSQSAELTLSAERIQIREGDDAREIARENVGGVYRHGSKVRIESVAGRVLFDDDVEGGREAIAAAFTRHGYPWESVHTRTEGESK